MTSTPMPPRSMIAMFWFFPVLARIMGRYRPLKVFMLSICRNMRPIMARLPRSTMRLLFSPIVSSMSIIILSSFEHSHHFFHVFVFVFFSYVCEC